MTSGRPAARTRNVTGTIAVASFVGIVAAFQIGANASAADSLSTTHGALVPPRPTSTASPTPTATAVPTAAAVAPPTTTTVTHSTKTTKPAPAPAPVAAAPAPAPAPVTPPVAKTKPSGG